MLIEKSKKSCITKGIDKNKHISSALWKPLNELCNESRLKREIKEIKIIKTKLKITNFITATYSIIIITKEKNNKLYGTSYRNYCFNVEQNNILKPMDEMEMLDTIMVRWNN